MRWKVWSCSLAAVFASIVGLNTTRADNDKNYPGSMCVDYRHSHDPVYSFSMIGNGSSTDSLNLDCVGIKDARDIRSAWVQVLDKHYSQNVSCTLFSVYWNNAAGSIFGWSENKKSAGSSNNSQFLTYGSKGANSKGHYFFSCNIPPRYSGNTSYIVNYHIKERT